MESCTSSIRLLWTLTRSCVGERRRQYLDIFVVILFFLSFFLWCATRTKTYWNVDKHFVNFNGGEEFLQRIQEVLENRNSFSSSHQKILSDKVIIQLETIFMVIQRLDLQQPLCTHTETIITDFDWISWGPQRERSGINFPDWEFVCQVHHILNLQYLMISFSFSWKEFDISCGKKNEL